MGTGVSIILIAVGAVLAWAVNATTSGFNVHTVGYILLVVGIIGLLLSMIFWSSWAGPGYFSQRRTMVADGPATGGRRTVVEEEQQY
jgi:ascorbate-specific PTS system EIIC-type component UlaA